MGEILIECSICKMEMKYSLLKTHICPGHELGEFDQLFELFEEIIGENQTEA